MALACSGSFSKNYFESRLEMALECSMSAVYDLLDVSLEAALSLSLLTIRISLQ